MTAPYYVWPERGKVYHDTVLVEFPDGSEGELGWYVDCLRIEARRDRGGTPPYWRATQRIPKGRRLCLRCRTLRAKGAKG